ncbi:hypothetical protein BKH43_07810 [Helicobacter sp. 13S00401-1]|uniref:hypothetical protein n=1 Tax=Helicobacter sp. 13S00401-1 TaxID=1905758 RepID=UPI000BA50258|nr:hypothetical protein [Helicobacter sp. 13S00401-1]PAF48613.1 hypothetical protein BKH43_07810 [Helicobacter sp. 13S00401-1]
MVGQVKKSIQLREQSQLDQLAVMTAYNILLTLKNAGKIDASTYDSYRDYVAHSENTSSKKVAKSTIKR